MKTVFFTLVSDNYYFPVGTPKMINSFKRFHPNIDLVIFRDDVIRPIFKEKGIDFYNAKPTFAKLLTDKYDLVVNIDADTVITERLEPVLKGNYEVGSVLNYNEYENASFENITEKMYLQAGLIAATKKSFWDDWERVNGKARSFVRRENDVMNKVIYGQGTKPLYNLKIFDGDYGYMGCKSLGQEDKFYMEKGKLLLNKEPVWAYHHAKGGVFPKLEYSKMGFTWEVEKYLEEVSIRGTSVKMVHV
jgi:hypothetical protein